MMQPRPLFVLTLTVVLASLAAFAVIGAEVRSYAVLGLVLCILLFAGVLHRPTRWLASGVTLALVLVGGVTMRPVCTLIPEAALAGFSPVPIEQRSDRSGYMPVFQQKDDGHWYQCKMAIERWFFF